MKKVFAMMLTCVLVMSSVSFASAEDARTSFLMAAAATALELVKEQSIMVEADPSSELVAGLVENEYEISFKASVTKTNGMYSSDNMEGLGIAYLLKQSTKTNGTLLDFEITVPPQETEQFGIQNIKFVLYADDEKIGLSLPAFSEEFYYIDYSKIGEMADKLGMDEYDIYYLMDEISKLSAGNIQLNIDAEKYKDLHKPYAEILKNAVMDAGYQLEGAGVLSDGVSVKNISLTFTAKQIDGILKNIAQTMQADEALREFADIMQEAFYSSYDYYSYLNELSLLDMFCYSLENAEVENDLVYTAGIGENGLILSHELTSGDIYTKVETKGQDYLLNDMLLDVKDLYYDTGVLIQINGNLVPVDGIYSAYIKAEQYENYAEIEEENYVVDLFFVDYMWDTNVKKDNFSLYAGFGEDGMEIEANFEKTEAQHPTEEEYNMMLDYYTALNGDYEKYIEGFEAGKDPLANIMLKYYPDQESEAMPEYEFSYTIEYLFGEDSSYEECINSFIYYFYDWGMDYYQGYYSGATIKMDGSLWIDNKNQKLIFENGNICFSTYGNYIELDVDMHIGATDSKTITMENPVDISGLTVEEIEALAEELTELYYSY